MGYPILCDNTPRGLRVIDLVFDDDALHARLEYWRAGCPFVGNTFAGNVYPVRKPKTTTPTD